nr:tRNA (guanosine(46)-N7)-methyltransferase TrmB [Microlunatus panaciterrae]
MTPKQRRSWEAHHDDFVLNLPQGATDTSIAPDAQVNLAAAFGREAPLIVEIGPGMGESLVPMAQARPNHNVLAFEVYQPAVARIMAKLAEQQVGNVRIIRANAVEGLERLLQPGQLDELWTFFPDPWPKSRHHKRRLVTTPFADLVASRLRPGGQWRLATDWQDYALQMRAVLDSHPAFDNDCAAGWAPRWPQRPMTKFEQRGIDAGRHIYDLAYRRR